jgi:hypothetical protein
VLLGKESKKGKKFGYKFMGTCNLCGKVGHKAYACWEDPGNESRCPKNWKSMTSNKSEVVEVALVSYIDFCLFESFLCEGFCLAVKEQVADKEE